MTSVKYWPSCRTFIHNLFKQAPNSSSWNMYENDVVQARTISRIDPPMHFNGEATYIYVYDKVRVGPSLQTYNTNEWIRRQLRVPERCWRKNWSSKSAFKHQCTIAHLERLCS